MEELDEVPEGARAIFSAHGVSPGRARTGRSGGGLKVIDATCPLVTKVHLEAVRFAREGYSIVLIGHRDHDEVIGTLGEAPDRSFLVETVEDVDTLEVPDPARVRYLTQTTLSLDETSDIVERLKQRFPLIQGPPAQDICYATQNRQMAVKAVAAAVRPAAGGGLAEQLQFQAAGGGGGECRRARVPGERPRRGRVRPGSRACGSVAVTAGASAPEHLVQELVAFLRRARFPRARGGGTGGGGRAVLAAAELAAPLRALTTIDPR